MVFSPFADDPHFYIRYPWIVIPCLSEFLYQFFYALRKRRIKVPPANGGIFVFFFYIGAHGVRFLFIRTFFRIYSFRPVPTGQVVRISGVFRLSAMPGLQPYKKNPGNYLDIYVFHAFPSMIAVSDNLVYPVIGVILDHIPLHIFFCQ